MYCMQVWKFTGSASGDGTCMIMAIHELKVLTACRTHRCARSGRGASGEALEHSIAGQPYVRARTGGGRSGAGDTVHYVRRRAAGLHTRTASASTVRAEWTSRLKRGGSSTASQHIVRAEGGAAATHTRHRPGAGATAPACGSSCPSCSSWCGCGGGRLCTARLCRGHGRGAAGGAGAWGWHAAPHLPQAQRPRSSCSCAA